VNNPKGSPDDLSFELEVKLADERRFIKNLFQEIALTNYPELNQMGNLSLRELLDNLFEEDFQDPRKLIWLVRLPDQTPVAFLWGREDNHPVSEEKNLLLLHLAVAKPYRGQGIATKLLEMAQEEAAQRKISSVRLFTTPKNPHAVHLYQKLGFTLASMEFHKQV
jgi:ribosomal protein S18 acetylase RimI-like enzyme